MIGRPSEVKRRRLLEVCLALVLVLGLASILIGEGHQPVQLSGRLLAADAR